MPKVAATSTGAWYWCRPASLDFVGGKQRIALPAFYIDQTEVPNARYFKFCQATNRPLPDRFPADKPNYPVVNVTIGETRAFAAWAGTHRRNAWSLSPSGTTRAATIHGLRRRNPGTNLLRRVSATHSASPTSRAGWPPGELA